MQSHLEDNMQMFSQLTGQPPDGMMGGLGGQEQTESPVPGADATTEAAFSNGDMGAAEQGVNRASTEQMRGILEKVPSGIGTAVGRGIREGYR